MARNIGSFVAGGNFEIQLQAASDARQQACNYTDLISADHWASNDGHVYLYKGLVVPVTSGSSIDLYMLTGDPIATPTCYQSYANWKKIGSESDVYLIDGAFFSLSTGDFSQLQNIVGTVADFKAAFLAHKIFLVYHHTISSDNMLSVVSVSANSNTAPIQYTIDVINLNARFTYTLTCNASSWTGLTVTTKNIAFEGEVVKSVAATANKGIEVAGTATAPTIGIKIDSTGNVKLSTGANGLKANYEDFATAIAASDKVLTADATQLKANLDLQYDSGTKQIKLLGKEDAVIATIDASDFIKDGMVNTVALSGNNLVFTFNTDAGKENITVDLSKFLDVYNQGNGISISGKIISVKPYNGIAVDSNGISVNINSGDKYLGYSAGKLVSKGIDEAIESMIIEALTIHDV